MYIKKCINLNVDYPPIPPVKSCQVGGEGITVTIDYFTITPEDCSLSSYEAFLLDDEPLPAFMTF